LTAFVEPIKPLLDAIRVVAEAASVALEPVVEALDILVTIVSAIDPSQFDIEFIVSLLANVSIVHLYPSQPYQTQRYPAWVETLAFSFGAGQDEIAVTLCNDPPFYLFGVLVEADTIGELAALATQLRRFFGYSATLFDDIPLELSRNLVQVAPANCENLEEIFPFLTESLGFLRANLKISGSSAVRAMQEAILEKLRGLQEIVDDIDAVLTALENLELPEIKTIVLENVGSLDDLYTLLVSAGGVEQNSFTAGSAMVVDVLGAAVMSPLLGFPALTTITEVPDVPAPPSGVA